jgi:hypothetical protein
MKKLLLPLTLALSGVCTMSVNAQPSPITDPFIVTINLTSACLLTTAPANFSIAYTSLQGTAASATTDFAVQCTNTLPYTMTLSGNADALGLTIPLVIRDAGDSADVSGPQTASGSAISYKIRADISAGQAGTCALGSCSTTVSRNLVITY